MFGWNKYFTYEKIFLLLVALTLICSLSVCGKTAARVVPSTDDTPSTTIPSDDQKEDKYYLSKKLVLTLDNSEVDCILNE